MSTQEPTSQFGWHGDGGLGDRLIDAIRSGRKTATCCPTGLYSEDEVDQIRATRGRDVTVLDRHGAPRCKIRVVDVFETPFGDPDLRLVEGEGFGDDVHAFQHAHRHVWNDMLLEKEMQLTSETKLLVELFELVHQGA